MRFENCTLHHNISHAIEQVEKLLHPSSKMIKELSQKNDFKFNSGLGSDVVLRLLTLGKTLKIFTYRPWNPFSRAMGYYDGKAIHININKIDSFDYGEICGLLLHEYAHHCGFAHGNNFPSKEKNLYSVPYFLSTNITKW